MREPQEKVIGGKTYSVTPLPAMRALRLWPLVARGFFGVDIAKGGADAIPLTRLTADEVEKLARELLSMARVDGVELLPQIDMVLQGDIPAMMDLLSFAVNASYSSFSTGSVDQGQTAGSGSAG
jgi:hypothetical protein